MSLNIDCLAKARFISTPNKQNLTKGQVRFYVYMKAETKYRLSRSLLPLLRDATDAR